MTRDDYAKKVIEIMTTKGIYAQYHKENFDDYGYLGEKCPISSDLITNMPYGSKIILSENVYKKLMNDIKDVTILKEKEIPFFLYGEEVEKNTIFFKNYYISKENNLVSDEADFSKDMIADLQDKIKKNINNSFVVCHGHSHPLIGAFHQNFSLGDFTTYMEMNQKNEVFREKKIELVGCVVTTTGDINFVFYDNKKQNFYRFTNLYVINKNNTLRPISCYSMNQANNNVSRSY